MLAVLMMVAYVMAHVAAGGVVVAGLVYVRRSYAFEYKRWQADGRGPAKEWYE